jgi:hypothetical protein
MKVNCRFLGAFFASFVIGSGVTSLGISEAWAYIPPSEFLLKSVARKHQGYKHIQIKTQVSQLDHAGQPTSVHFTEQTVYSSASDTLKSWASDEHGTLLFATERNEQNFPAAAILLFEARSARLIEILKSKGLPIQTEAELAALPGEDERHASEKEGMARWNHAVAWVIGTQTPIEPANVTANVKKASEAVPELWLEKDTFLPLRLKISLKDGEPALGDLQFDSYRFYNEFPYPRVVTWVNGKDPYLRGDVLDATADSGPDLSKQSLQEGWTPAGESASGTLRELIKGYYQTFR